jgi:hypothetical protein
VGGSGRGRFQDTIMTLNDLVFLRSLRRLLVKANVVRSSSILVTLMMEALGSSETSVRTSHILLVVLGLLLQSAIIPRV